MYVSILLVGIYIIWQSSIPDIQITFWFPESRNWISLQVCFNSTISLI